MNVQVIDARREFPSGYKVDVSRGERIGRVSSEWFSRPVNRHPKLTPDRRSKLTPICRRAERERSPRRSWSGLRSRGECVSVRNGIGSVRRGS
jgi:hypothetical protein